MIWVAIILGGVFLVLMLWAISQYETSCTGDCEQGRRCNCLIGRKDDE